MLSFPEEEERVLAYWNEINAFHRQLELTQSKPTYTFYDGPPFATGTPHYGHLLASTIKDIIPRYWSMKGRHVERRFGWDTHGVPIEQIIDNQLQKELGVRGATAVEQIGIADYNRRCRAVVLEYANEWRKTIGRLGRWIDFDNDYKTMDASFMESCWWVFKQLFDKDMVYHGAKVLPYSLALATPLSNSEAGSDYQMVSDPSIVVAFPLVDEPATSFIAWTTTPWTIPSNIALCANPTFEYMKILDEESGKQYILHEIGLGKLYKDPKKAKFKILEKYRGTELLGMKYLPPFDYFYEEFKDFGFKILNDEYVKDTDGTGIVHQAPAYGAEDQGVCAKAGVISDKRHGPDPMDAHGHYLPVVRDFEGQHIRAAEKSIMKHLESIGKLVKKSQIVHSIGHCPRSKTPLIQRAVPSWFISVEPLIPKLLHNLESTHWVPESVKTGRFHNWLAAARDWNVSRNRFWGTPLPLWVSDDHKEIVCVGSVEELKKLSGHTGDIQDLHRDVVDEITIPSKQGKGTLRRVTQVFDCWFESGSMPYASCHYPFDNPDKFDDRKFGDFIAEGLDQTRGWFYSMSVLGTALFDTFPYRNCVVNGMVLAENGKKMSKSLQNYPDPTLVMKKYGSDALRLYLIDSPVVRGEPLNFKEAGVKQIISSVLLPLWNSYNFFDQQISQLKKDGGDFTWDPKVESSNTNVMDRWILASCQSLLKFIDREMEMYRLYTVVPRLLRLIEDTTNWYIRFNRERLKGKGELGEEDRSHSLNTLFEVLFTLVRALAPFTPFITDNIYKRLAVYIPESQRFEDMRSVHFLPFPTARQELFDADVERRVERMQQIIEQGRIARDRRKVSLKTPMKQATVVSTDDQYLADIRSLESYILVELNVQELVLTADERAHNVEYKLTADLKSLGIKYKKDSGKIVKAIPSLTVADIAAFRERGQLEVAGYTLTTEDLRVIKSVASTPETANNEVATTNESVLILDTFAYPELAQETMMRECVNRIQRLRKRVNLVPTDDVVISYSVVQGNAAEIETMFSEREEAFQKAASAIEKEGESTGRGAGGALVADEQIDFNDVILAVKLIKL